MPSAPTEILIFCLLALANGFLAVAETAVVAARKSRLRKLATEGDAGAAKALALAEQPTRFLALVQFWLTVSVLIAGILGGVRLTGQVARRLEHVSLLAPAAVPVALVLVTLGLSFFLLLTGELLPKRIGLAYPEKAAALLAGPMQSLAWLAAPVLRLLELGTDALARLLHIKPRPAAESVAEEDVRALVERGLSAGVFQRAEAAMVDRVLALDLLPVTALMTPRPKIVFLNLDDPEEANWRRIVTSGHSYFPVYQNNRDQVVGMVAVKALWAHAAIGLPTTLKNLMLPVFSVSETMTAIQVLEHFKKSGRHTAIVVDEFGATQGMVTLIDVLEAIVGDLPERGRRNQPEAKRLEDGSWLVEATLPVGEFKTTLGLTAALPHEDEAAYQTLGGFVVTHLGRIPEAGDAFEWGGWRFEVTEMDRRRVDKVLVKPVSAAGQDEAGEERAAS
jgi:putative hemolysin